MVENKVPEDGSFWGAARAMIIIFTVDSGEHSSWWVAAL